MNYFFKYVWTEFKKHFFYIVPIKVKSEGINAFEIKHTVAYLKKFAYISFLKQLCTFFTLMKYL